MHYCCSSMPRLSEACRFLQSSSFWEARRALIGQLFSVLWFAEYLNRVTEMLRPSPYCDGVSQQDETKTIKPIINVAFVAFNGDIINTMSAFLIGETTNNKHYSTLLKTHVWIVSSRNILTGCESEASDCPCKVGIALLYRNSLCASQ